MSRESPWKAEEEKGTRREREVVGCILIDRLDNCCGIAIRRNHVGDRGAMKKAIQASLNQCITIKRRSLHMIYMMVLIAGVSSRNILVQFGQEMLSLKMLRWEDSKLHSDIKRP